MPQLGIPELVIILVIVMLVFGVGRLGDIGGAVGKGIREFKKASSGELDTPQESENES
jgi:sec-independent protein translocase protein TatA